MGILYGYKYIDKPALVLVALYSFPVLATDDPKSTGDDISNNLLSDLAPLIALFGEQVAKQYLSQSMHWLEHVIFACAPLGMITAITCAIRVAGNKTLKAIIGRAREPSAQAEIEVMSSTSSDVCELWNGIGIVRVPGSPDVIELLYDRNNAGGMVDQDSKNHHGVYARKDILVSSQDTHNSWTRNTGHMGLLGTMLGMLFRGKRGDTDSESYPLLVDAAAPNISLNTTNPSVKKWELRLVALIGVIIQAGALVFDWTVVNYSGWQWNKDGSKAPKYGFPLTVVGTLAVFAGMFLCAYVIERSTVENEWGVKPGNRASLQILWLQREQTVNDQRFKSYAIYAAKSRNTITTSRPLESKEKHYHILTTLAAVISVFGFILQFVGLRAMHYSATLCQLLAMATMTTLRVVLRRNLTAKLENLKEGTEHMHDWSSNYVKELPKDYELDFIAKQMVGCSEWNVLTRSFLGPESIPEIQTDMTRVLKARVRLGQMAEYTWKAKLHDTVTSLIETMETVMNHLWSPSGGGISPTQMKLGEFKWTLPVTTTSGTAMTTESSNIELTLVRRAIGEDLGPWKAKREDIEAVFSLWMSHLSEFHPMEEEAENLWVIGTSGEGGDDVGRILCDWWISREIDSIDLKTSREDNDFERELCDWWVSRGADPTSQPTSQHNCRVLYCMKATSKKGVLQGIINTTSLSRMCVQFILSKFMTAAAKEINPITSETTIEPITSKRLLKITNKDVNGLAEILTRSGLANIDDAYRIIVPSLFEADKLPEILGMVPEILDRIKRFGDDQNDKNNQADMGKVCERIRNLCIHRASTFIAEGKSDNGRVECMQLVKALVEGLGCEHPETTIMRQHLRVFGRNLIEDLIETPPESRVASGHILDIQTDTEDDQFPLHHAVRTGRIRDLRDALIKDKDRDINELSNEGKSPLSEAVQQGNDTMVKVLLSFGADTTSCDGTKQMALHFAMSSATGTTRRNIINLLLDNGANINERDPDKKTPLHLLAAIDGVEGDVVNLLVKRGATLDLKDSLGRTAMQMAAEVGNQAIVELLVKKGADPDIKDNYGRSAIHKAAEKGFVEIVKFLIKKGSDQFMRDKEGRTAMHGAASNGCEEVVKYLLREGVDPDSRDKQGGTAMHKAARNGKRSIVRFFLEKGSDPDLKDNEGRTAMHEAASEDQGAILKLLAERGGDLNAKDKHSRTAIHNAAEKGHQVVLQLLIDMGCDPDSRDDTGETPIQKAASNGHKSAVELLVQNGADPDAKDKCGRTAIHKAAETGQQELVELFLERGSGPDVKDYEGNMAIHVAAHSGHQSIVELLTQMGINLDVTNKLGQTVLYLAAGMGRGTVVELLLNKGSDSNATENQGKTALHIAASNGHETVVQQLLRLGKNRDIKDNLGRTAMHRAAEMGQQECVRLLLKGGADVGTRDMNGETVIHTAAGKGYVTVVQLLLENRANLNVKSGVGKTPLHMAVEGGYGEVVKILLRNGADLGARDNSGKTAANIAEERGEGTVKDLLLGTRRK